MNRMAGPTFPQDVKHLIGRPLTSIELEGSDGQRFDFSKLAGTTVIFVQPGSSSAITPIDGWVDGIMRIPGAAGCTGQCNAFQKLKDAFSELGVRVIGVSGQTPEELSAVKQRLGISYHLVSDARADWLNALGMRQVSYASPDGSGDKPYHPRMILVVRNGSIVDARVPEATPAGASASAQQVLEGLTAQR